MITIIYYILSWAELNPTHFLVKSVKSHIFCRFHWSNPNYAWSKSHVSWFNRPPGENRHVLSSFNCGVWILNFSSQFMLKPQFSINFGPSQLLWILWFQTPCFVGQLPIFYTTSHVKATVRLCAPKPRSTSAACAASNAGSGAGAGAGARAWPFLPLAVRSWMAMTWGWFLAVYHDEYCKSWTGNMRFTKESVWPRNLAYK